MSIPLIVMTYYNLVHHDGHRRFAHRLVRPGSTGASSPTCRSRSRSRGRGPPTTKVSRRSCSRRRRRPTSGCPASPPARAGSSIRSVCSVSPASAATLAATATALAARLMAITDVPVLVGVGVSDAPQACEATRVADGVVQGASVVRRLMEGGADAVGDYVAEVRAAIDATETGAIAPSELVP